MAANRAVLIEPIHRTVELRVADHTFKRPRLKASTRRVVVDIHIKSRSTEHRAQTSDKTIDWAHTNKVESVFKQAVVVGCKDLEAIACRGPTGEAQEER